MAIEIILVSLIFIFIVMYRTKRGNSVYSFINEQVNSVYDK